MRKCPYCAEEIQDEAIKCRYCGEMLGETEQVLTTVTCEQWASRGVVMRSDGTPKAFLDAVAHAVEAAEYPITERSYADLKLCYESRGISWKSWSGDITTVLFEAIDGGSKATFTSKGKPSGAMRIQKKANAVTWAERIIPGFGELWSDER